MGMRKAIILGGALVMFLPAVVAAREYSVSGGFSIMMVGNNRYVVYDVNTSHEVSDHYTCGMSPDYGGPQYRGHWYSLQPGDIIEVNGDYYYCCSEGGSSFVDVTVEYPLNESQICGTAYQYAPLGDNKYCYSSLRISYANPCGGYGEYVSGVGYTDAPGCNRGLGDIEYCNVCEFDKTCTTFTHCGQGYYKDGDKCVQCPDGGTTSGYTNGGKTDCYIPRDTPFQDDTGSGEYVLDCHWKE